MRVIYDLCTFVWIVCFIGKSVKKIVGVDYCIDVCIGGNDELERGKSRMCTYNKSSALDLYFYINVFSYKFTPNTTH